MLDKLKKINKFRKVQSETKKQLEQIFVSSEKRDISIVVRGDKKIERIIIDGEEQKLLKELLNDAMKEVDKKVEKQLKGQLGDLDFSGLF